MHYAFPPTTHPGGGRAAACIRQKPGDRDFTGLVSELSMSLTGFRRHEDLCLDPTWRNAMAKAVEELLIFSVQGKGGCPWASGTSISGRARMPEPSAELWECVSGMQVIFKENHPRA